MILSETNFNEFGILLLSSRKKNKIMSCTRRNFSVQFKTKLVLEVLKGEKDINTIATENDI